MRSKTGGVGFVIKSDMECQRIIYDSEDICFIINFGIKSNIQIIYFLKG